MCALNPHKRGNNRTRGSDSFLPARGPLAKLVLAGLTIALLISGGSKAQAQGQLGNFWQASTDYFHVFNTDTKQYASNPVVSPAQDYNVLLDGPSPTITIYNGSGGAQGTGYSYQIANIFGFYQVYDPKLAKTATVSYTPYADGWVADSSVGNAFGVGDFDLGHGAPGSNILQPGTAGSPGVLTNSNLGSGNDLGDFNFGATSGWGPGQLFWGVHLTVTGQVNSSLNASYNSSTNTSTLFTYFTTTGPGPSPSPVPEPAFVQFGTLAALAAIGAGFRRRKQLRTA